MLALDQPEIGLDFAAARHRNHLSPLQTRPLEDVGPHRAERLRQAAGIDQADPWWYRQALQCRNRGILAIAVADHQRADLVADPPFADTLAQLHHRAGA